MNEQVQELVRKRRILLPAYPETAERAEVSIRGPLGIWNFPFLNGLLQFLYAIRTRAAPAPQAYLPRMATRRVEYVRDREGRIIERFEEVELP